MQVKHLLCRAVADGNGFVSIDGNNAAEGIVDNIVQAAGAGTLLDVLVNNIAGGKHSLMHAVLAGAYEIVGQAILRRLFNDASAKSDNGNIFQRGKAGNNTVEVLLVAVDDLTEIFKSRKGRQRFNINAQIAVVSDAEQVLMTL